MKGRARRARVDERCIHRWMRKFESLRDRQGRRCRRHGRTCQGDHGADRANIIRMPIRILARRRKLLGGLDRRRNLRCDSMKMAEQQRKLNCQRKQRDLRAKFDVRSKPLHAETRLESEAEGSPSFRRYCVTSQGMLRGVNRSPSAGRRNSLVCVIFATCDTNCNQRPSQGPAPCH